MRRLSFEGSKYNSCLRTRARILNGIPGSRGSVQRQGPVGLGGGGAQLTGASPRHLCVAALLTDSRHYACF